MGLYQDKPIVLEWASIGQIRIVRTSKRVSVMDYYNTLRGDIHESAVMGIQRGGREREMGCAGKALIEVCQLIIVERMMELENCN